MTSKSVDELSEAVADFARQRDWSQFHDPKNLVMAVASEVGELAALLRWVSGNESDAATREEPLRSQLKDEIADVAILLLLLCKRTGVALDVAVQEKLIKNASKYPVEESRGRAGPPSLR